MSTNHKKTLLLQDIKSKRSIEKWVEKNIIVDQNMGVDCNSWAPILITTNLYSYFNSLKNRIGRLSGNLSGVDIQKKKENVERNISATKARIEKNLNFLNNSSIWIRLCDHGNDSKSESIKDAQEEFQWFQEMKLYDFKPAQEYIEYQSRSQKENHLNEIKGTHGAYITPTIFSDEVEFRDFFLKGLSSPFKFLSSDKTKTRAFKTEDVALRILLVDDKIWDDSNKWTSHISACEVCDPFDKEKETGCKGFDTCKLRVIRSLLSGNFIPEEEKNKQTSFRSHTYWADTVKAFRIKSITVSDIWKKDSGKLELKKEQDGILNTINTNLKYDNADKEVQVVGVYDIETAVALLSCCKFDIILLDYLLDARGRDDFERSYSTELFEFLSYKESTERPVPAIIKMLQRNGFSAKEIVEFQDIVKLNRGPLDKFWIVPMTSYNSSFISDLQSKHVPLIDHRWNISQGADPINTPWKFLYKLNEFVDLQLRLSVFWESQLLAFLQFSGEDFEQMIRERRTGSCFNEFQQFMGSEYADLMKRYGAQRLIERDSIGKGINYSLFAQFIREQFYGEYEHYGIVTELNRLMQTFYHRASAMFDDRHGRQRLREAYERLRVFIAYNSLDKDNDKLQRELQFFRVVIDSEFEWEKINQWLVANR